ncbi:MAG: iron ABC transporter permease [Pseudomonadota bacterium]
MRNPWLSGSFLISLLALVPAASVLWALTVRSGEIAHLFQTVLSGYIVNTLVLMIGVGTLATIIGVSTAWLVTAIDFPGRRWFSWLLGLPLAAPAYIIAYVYTDLLDFSGPVQSTMRQLFSIGAADYSFPEIRSLPGACLVLGFVLYPYVYLLARASFAAQSRSQFMAARTLGLSPLGAFFRVVLPGARPAIAGGLALVLMETLADFGVAEYFAIPTLSTGVFRTWLAMGDRISAMKIAAVMLLFVMILVTLEAVSRRGNVASEDRLSAGKPPMVAGGFGAAMAIGVCLVPVLIGFLIPVGQLIFYAVKVGDGVGATTLSGYALSSIQLGLYTAVFAGVLAVFLGYAQRASLIAGSASALLRGSIRAATLGYALPGALLAVGLLVPFASIDRALAKTIEAITGERTGLILTGSIALLVYALIIRFLTVAFNSVSGGFAKIPLSMDHAARSLGKTRSDVIRLVHIPLLAPSLGAGCALVFVDTIRELPATLILRPFNFETLATRVYRLASDERIAEASTAALLIILVGTIPLLLMARFEQK